MKIGFIAVAAACIGALVLSAGPAAANDVGTSKAGTAYESGFEATQGRRGRGGIRRGGGRNNTGRNIALGAGALIIGGIIASQASSARGGGNSCSRWSYHCDRGSRSACYNLDRYC